MKPNSNILIFISLLLLGCFGANTVDVNETQLDGPVKEMVWCGVSEEITSSTS